MDLRQQGCFRPREPVTGKRKSHACHLPGRFSSSEVKRKKQSRGDVSILALKTSCGIYVRFYFYLSYYKQMLAILFGQGFFQVQALMF